MHLMLWLGDCHESIVVIHIYSIRAHWPHERIEAPPLLGANRATQQRTLAVIVCPTPRTAVSPRGRTRCAERYTHIEHVCTLDLEQQRTRARVSTLPAVTSSTCLIVGTFLGVPTGLALSARTRFLGCVDLRTHARACASLYNPRL